MPNVHRAEIIGKRLLSEDTVSIQFHCPEIASIAKPGQFVMVRPSNADNGYDPITPRPYSIYAPLAEKSGITGFSLIIKILGRGSEAICSNPDGAKLQCTGPLGNCLEIDPARHCTMVAGGTGIAPVAFAALEMEQLGASYSILYGGKNKRQVHLDELSEFGLSALPATEDGSLGHHGLVTEMMEIELKRNNSDKIVFACGPWNMMRAATGIAQSLDTPCYCSLERYMACGFGVCLACVYRKHNDDGYHTCCLEGPVVNGMEVDWDA